MNSSKCADGEETQNKIFFNKRNSEWPLFGRPLCERIIDSILFLIKDNLGWKGNIFYYDVVEDDFK